jgi:hypothetical protein
VCSHLSQVLLRSVKSWEVVRADITQITRLGSHFANQIVCESYGVIVFSLKICACLERFFFPAIQKSQDKIHQYHVGITILHCWRQLHPQN